MGVTLHPGYENGGKERFHPHVTHGGRGEPVNTTVCETVMAGAAPVGHPMFYAPLAQW